MNNIPEIGVFLCKCGEKIEPLVDLSDLKIKLAKEPDIACCEILPYPCLAPGLNHIIRKIREKGLNRIVIAGCESRLMLKKFEKKLEPEGFKKGQVDIVNLRGHVANVSDISPKEKAEKGAKLIKAAVAEMVALKPSIQTGISIENPPIIVGGGIASFAAARELSSQGIDTLLSLSETDTESIINNIYKYYPGERHNYNRLKKMIEEVKNSSHVKMIPENDIADFSGITGDYTISFAVPEETARLVRYKAGTVIACLDEKLSPPGPEFGYDGTTVLCQTDFENLIWNKDIPTGQIVFWINDYETGQEEFAQLSARSAWTMAKHVMKNSMDARVVILHNEQMSLPLSASERAEARKIGLVWIPYDKSLQPILQSDFINFGGIDDHLEHELPWDKIVLSPIRKAGKKTLEIAKLLGIVNAESESLNIHHAKVRPEMVGREETHLAGSAGYFCDLNTALGQGRTAGKKNAEMLKKAGEGQLYAPRFVSIVNVAKCVGCGQCQALCDCNAISITEGTGGGLPRVVDPMICTGGGTCVAACPYLALTLQNSTNEQREARVASLSGQMTDNEFVAFACSWAGLPAADNAGNMGLKYDPKIHIIGVPCLGQIDPCVMARAFIEGTPGLLLVGCAPEDCHHSFGVDHAWSRINLIKKLFSLCGFNRERIVLAHADLNQPEEFIRTVESFSKTLQTLGPIEKTPENQSKLQSIYRLVKYNSRIRLLLSSGLRRPWETTYKGDQQYALMYDHDDFSEALKEEFLKARLEEIFMADKRSFGLEELANAISNNSIGEQLDELIAEGVISQSYQDGKPLYTSLLQK